MIPILRTAAPRLAEQIIARIRTEVGVLSGPRRSRLHRLVRESVMAAVDAFLGLAAGDDEAVAVVEEHFWALGRGSATSGVGIEPVLAAVQVATDSIWQAIHALVGHDDLSAQAVADLGLGMSTYLKYLTVQVQRGFNAEVRAQVDARGALLTALLRDRAGQDLAALADAAGWGLSESVVVLTAQCHGAVAPVGLALAPRALTRLDGDRMIVVTDLDHLAPAREMLLQLGPLVVVAESWPVPLGQTRDACRWTRRALALVHAGRVRPTGRVVACEGHRITLLIEADPPLMESLASDLLAPLVGQGPHQRWVLAETLLLWLEADEKAPTLAERLGTHPQTIRNRIRRLREMFGDSLTEPEQRMTLILVLNAVLPRWRAEQRRR
jgi:hypothetical protein